jgi:DNA-binding CsgD family transcriptional regulator
MNLKVDQYRLRLSPTELRVSSLVELPNREIARLLGMSHHTVKVHVKNALQKTGADNRTMLRRMMIEQEHAELAEMKRLRELGAA